MHLRMLLRPAVFPFMRLRGHSGLSARRQTLTPFALKRQGAERSPAAARGRRFAG